MYYIIKIILTCSFPTKDVTCAPPKKGCEDPDCAGSSEVTDAEGAEVLEEGALADFDFFSGEGLDGLLVDFGLGSGGAGFEEEEEEEEAPFLANLATSVPTSRCWAGLSFPSSLNIDCKERSESRRGDALVVKNCWI